MISEVFKYNSIISVPLFGIIEYFLIQNNKDFSFKSSTISKSILVLKGSKQAIFRFNFLLKALLDFGFFLFIIQYFQLSWQTIIPWFFVIETVLFASLAYFIEGTYSLIHKIVTYASGVAWMICQLCLAYVTKDVSFTYFTWVVVTIVMGITFGYGAIKKTNVIVQIVCMLILYSWLAVLVFKFL